MYVQSTHDVTGSVLSPEVTAVNKIDMSLPSLSLQSVEETNIKQSVQSEGTA